MSVLTRNSLLVHFWQSEPRVFCVARVCSQTPFLVGVCFCAGLERAIFFVLGLEWAWSIFVTMVDWYKDGGGCLCGMLASEILGLKCESAPVLGRVCPVCRVFWRGPYGWKRVDRSAFGSGPPGDVVRSWEFRQWLCEKASGLVDSDLLALQPRALSCQD